MRMDRIIKATRCFLLVVAIIFFGFAAWPQVVLAKAIGAYGGYYTNPQRPPEETYHDVPFVGRTSDGYWIHEIPKGTYGAIKCNLHNSGGAWVVAVVQICMMPGRLHIYRGKFNIAPDSWASPIIPTQFAISNSGKKFVVEATDSSGNSWSVGIMIRTKQ